MKKIIIIVTSGSGKSTLAKDLISKLGYDYIALDALFWKAHWTQSTDEEFFEKIEKSIDQDTWIIDGNYARTSPITWSQADTLIWIDLSYWQSIYQVIKRSIRRIITRENLCGVEGNRETLRITLGKDSVIRWAMQTYHRNREKYLERIKPFEYTHIKFIHLKSRKMIREFLNEKK